MSRLLDPDDVKSRAKSAYDTLQVIWPETDSWSSHTRRSVEQIVQSAVPPKAGAILNAGCGRNEYGITPRARKCINLDISLHQCQGMQHALVADVEAMPFPNAYFDVVLCVGAVMNYCEPYAAIPELFRIARRGGLIVIDFETTQSAELLFSSHWNKRVSVIERQYAGRPDKTLLFSADHIRRIIGEYAAITKTIKYHTATAAWARFFRSMEMPRAILAMDAFMSRIPVVNSLASNVIFVCQKLQ